MKKGFSLFLVIAIVFTIFAIPVQAETLTYTDTVIKTITNENIIDIEDFKVTIDVDESKILCFDGASVDYNCTINSINVVNPDTSSFVNIENDPEAFAAVFSTQGFLNRGTELYIDFMIEFQNDAVFGELDYDIIITGFSSPLDTGLDLGGLLGGSTGVALPVAQDIIVSGNFPEFPTIDFSKIKRTQAPVKTVYSDAERFDATGTQFEITLTTGVKGTLSYTKETTSFFNFIPTVNENLTCHDTEVTTLLLGHPVNYTPIVVEHQWSDGPVNITTGKYSDNKPGYHATVCEGCGETHDAQKHIPAGEWTYNNDETFVANGTESNICKDCGTVLTRDTFGTAGFNTTFADMHFIQVIFEYINILITYIGAAKN